MTILGYKVEFEHFFEPGKPVVAEDCTVVTLTDLVSEQIMWVGRSRIHPADLTAKVGFNKRLGRIGALKSVLKQVPTSRQERRKAWNEYWAWTNHQDRITDAPL